MINDDPAIDAVISKAADQVPVPVRKSLMKAIDELEAYLRGPQWQAQHGSGLIRPPWFNWNWSQALRYYRGLETHGIPPGAFRDEKLAALAAQVDSLLKQVARAQPEEWLTPFAARESYSQTQKKASRYGVRARQITAAEKSLVYEELAEKAVERKLKGSTSRGADDLSLREVHQDIAKVFWNKTHVPDDMLNDHKKGEQRNAPALNTLRPHIQKALDRRRVSEK